MAKPSLGHGPANAAESDAKQTILNRTPEATLEELGISHGTPKVISKWQVY
jgi:hypothetical protein